MALSALLERQRQILAESRLRLNNRFEQASASPGDRIVSAGDALVAAASEDAVSQAALDEFESEALAHSEALSQLAAKAFQRELDELDAKERGLVQGPKEIETLVDQGLFEPDFHGSTPSPLETGPTEPRSPFGHLVRDFAAERAGLAWPRRFNRGIALGRRSTPSSTS